jgi:uncharacterized membrane protein (UPF0182 family)
MSWSSLISFGNLLLAAAVIAGLFLKEWWQRILVFVIAGFFVKFYPGFDVVILFFLLSAAFGVWLGNLLKTKTSIAFVAAVISAEIIFNGLLFL